MSGSSSCGGKSRAVGQGAGPDKQALSTLLSNLGAQSLLPVGKCHMGVGIHQYSLRPGSKSGHQELALYIGTVASEYWPTGHRAHAREQILN